MWDIALVRNAGIILEIVSEWGSWSPCEKCKFGKGRKASRAHCRIKRKLEKVTRIQLYKIC